ncbi:3-hydroxyacyl-CoA dehydrogenase [Pseudomonas nabeulensis]|uniref:3-hydroxyacyl-CoA dehydrogenase n=1 Tax=Pseudomonas nabeulensis TaxID=2293833 RepID=A0A4Z0B754_9PSED|nr:3-hydroxyacyl-CoA dehydrogenase [Pseudomonas nabeulensis]TFY94249.1 3-hydroxyacyl-CoA dehydrogenase [Pseudomonas nabeulensis]
MTLTCETIAVIGAGSIGLAFTLLFAQAGYTVNLYDSNETALDLAKDKLSKQATLLAGSGFLACSVEDLTARVSLHDSLPGAVKDVIFVQECVLETLAIKQAVFQQLEQHAPLTAVFASSSSALPSSDFCQHLDCAPRCLVGHPGNPPFLIPVIEIVPSSRTAAASVELARQIYTRCALKPVVLNKEIKGFIFNRLQGAVLREAYSLVSDGVASVEDIDTVVKHGLGLRWSVIGPFETSDLNYRGGISDHAQRMGQAYADMAAERTDTTPWSAELVAEVARQRRALLPLEDWVDRVSWRDAELLALRVAKREREQKP